MILQPPKALYFNPNFTHLTPSCVSSDTIYTPLKIVSRCCKARDDEFKELKKSSKDSNIISSTSRFCSCVNRRHLIQTFGTALFSMDPSFGSETPPNDPMDMLNKIHPPRPGWYEDLYALAMKKCTKSYEAEVGGCPRTSNLCHLIEYRDTKKCLFSNQIAGYKSQLFANLRGKANKILEVGIGTGPNLKYYASEPGLEVFGVDPIMKMEKYARAAAEDAGLSLENFKFMQAV